MHFGKWNKSDLSEIMEEMCLSCGMGMITKEIKFILLDLYRFMNSEKSHKYLDQEGPKST